MFKRIKMQNLNLEQEKLINTTEGIFLVDAGAGTGKTFTLTKRFETLLKKTDSKNILMLTFTNAAANNMKDKIVSSVKDLNINDTNISTFHSFCNTFLRKHGLVAPSYLGFNKELSPNYNLIENQIIEEYNFNQYIKKFKLNNIQHEHYFTVMGDNYLEILYLIKKLSSKGIFPTRNSWFNNTQEQLIGNLKDYGNFFNIQNSTQSPTGKLVQSKILKSFNSKSKYNIYADLPDNILLDKSINANLIEQAFNDKRSCFFDFIHDVFYQYIDYCLTKNYLNFDLLIIFTFVSLYSNSDVRHKYCFEYIMIDEFQDTNELQFMLTLLLLDKPNLCVVGDWKQGIYSFQNANIQNILDFEKKLKLYKDTLNQGEQRINFDVTIKSENKIYFKDNYRSSQSILDFSKNSLLAKASLEDEIESKFIQDNFTELNAKTTYNNSSIEFIQSENEDSEIQDILKKIVNTVKNNTIEEYDGNQISSRIANYSDVAVLCRGRKFALKLQKQALKNNIPANFEGGVELFKTPIAKLTLAYLRLMSNINNKSGWVTILEKENYNFASKKEIISNKNYPKKLIDFIDDLKQQKNIIFSIELIFKKYNVNTSISDALLYQIENLFSSSITSLGKLIYFFEQNIEKSITYNVELDTSFKGVTIQTIHASKGLEYPIVFIADCNKLHFPSLKTDNGLFTFHELIGLRIKKEKNSVNGHEFLFNKWQTDLLTSNLFREYDEERRLLYVAITRAKQYLFFTSHKSSTFFEHMSKGYSVTTSNKDELKVQETPIENLTSQILLKEYRQPQKTLSVHSIMTYQETTGGLGIDFGSRVHENAHKYTLTKTFHQTKNQSEQQANKNIKAFLDSQTGNLIPEIECSLPVKGALIRGIIDLLIEDDTTITIIDYKTDLNKVNKQEYIKQLSVYYHVVKKLNSSKKVICKIFYVMQNEHVQIEPLTQSQIETFINP